MRFVYFILMTLFAAGAVSAETMVPASGANHIAITLVPETTTPASGSTITLAIESIPQKGWHGYWKNPGDAGVETRATWTLPRGVSAGPIEYPIPHRLVIAGLMNYVYEGPFAQFVRLTLPSGLAVGTRLTIAAKLDYLVCTDEICVPESGMLGAVLTIGDGAVDPATRARFDIWRRAMPRPLGSAATYAVAGDRFRLAVPYPAASPATDPYFFPLTDGVIDYGKPQTVTRDGDTLLVETVAKAGRPATVQGVLAVGADRGFLVTASRGEIAGAASGGIGWTLLIALGGAVLGGLLLNIMPCVFPILSLKALSLAKSGGDGAKGEAVAYTAGVVLVCLALGGLLLVLRAGGASVGWAFQLTDPRVILVLLLLVTGIAFNLAGLFELAAPGFANRLASGGSGKAGLGGSFGTGALAAFVATPCTGPFMGAAMGTALVLPWWGALAVFGGLGFGLALPFLLIGFVPVLRRALPKPGAWMETFRHVLSVPMFLTALALAWVLGQQAGVDGMTLGLAGALVLAAGLWWTGTRQARGRSRAWVPGTLAAVLALGGSTLVTRAPTQAAATAVGEPFTEARLAALRAEGRPVFAYFTADWCVTCKVNEKAVIETAAVRSALKDGKVAVLVGDWTDGDPALGRFIERHNRAGVPLYLWYARGAGEAEVLPQLLTQAMMTSRSGG